MLPLLGDADALYRGTSLIRNTPPTWGHRRALGIVLLQGPRGALFLMSEVPLLQVSSLERGEVRGVFCARSVLCRLDIHDCPGRWSGNVDTGVLRS
jgi:hypothetical protein